VLTRALGQQLIIRPDFSRVQLQPGDTLLLCSDGVWSEVEDGELSNLASDLSPDRACEEIIGVCLERGCDDNVTVQVVRIHSVGLRVESERSRRPFLSGLFGRGDGTRIRREQG
jgi:protein phosphatase